MKKRVFSLILALALCLGLAVIPASAYDMGKAGEWNVISVGDYHTAAIDANGSLWMWERGRVYGQPANTTTGGGESFDAPVKVLDNVTAVSCGYDYTGAIKTDGTLWMWGENYCGKLGNGTTTYSAVPVKVLDNVAAVSCGYGHTAAIKTDGTLWMWGRNDSGQLGNGTTTDSNVPVKVLNDVAAVSCAGDCTAAIRTDGTLWMWGANDNGQLGNGGVGNANETTSNIIQTVPVKVLDNVTAVSCGGGGRRCDHTAAIKTDGSLWMWGSNSEGELGNGGVGNANKNGRVYQTVPVKVLDGVAAVSCGTISADGGSMGYTAAIKTDGSLWMWGGRVHGQLGDGNIKDAFSRCRTVPAKVLDNVAAVSCCGGVYPATAAVKTDGSLWTWGCDGDLNNISYVPVRISLTVAKGVRLYLNGGTGGGVLWTNSTGTIQVPTNPTRAGYTFGGWYTDAALTKPWNFNDKVVNTLTLYAKWTPVSSTATTTDQNVTGITLNGKKVEVQTTTLVADNGYAMNYVKLRDMAALLDGTGSQFNVDWRRGAIYVDTGKRYTTRNGTELKPIQGADGSYEWDRKPMLVNGVTVPMEGILVIDGKGGGHTFFKLADLAEAVGFTVKWVPGQGIVLETK